jgi:hypothetical protein
MMVDETLFPGGPEFWEDVFKRVSFREKVSKFFADEHAVALLRSSYGGDGGI